MCGAPVPGPGVRWFGDPRRGGWRFPGATAGQLRNVRRGKCGLKAGGEVFLGVAVPVLPLGGENRGPAAWFRMRGGGGVVLSRVVGRGFRRSYGGGGWRVAGRRVSRASARISPVTGLRRK